MKGALGRKATEHFHIALDKHILGGRPIIKGTRVSIANIVEYYLMGLSPEEIQRELPHLHLAQIYDVIAYYLDHRETIDRYREGDREEKVSKSYPAAGGVCWEKPERWPVQAWIKAMQRCVDRALETGTVLHLWFHPSCDPVNVEEVFPAVLKYLSFRRDDLWFTTMGGMADSLLELA